MALKRKNNLLTSSIENGQLKWLVIGSVLLAGIVFGGGYLLYRGIKKKKTANQLQNIEKLSLTEGSLENIAKKIALELEKPFYENADENLVIEAVKLIKTQKEYNQVIDIYAKLTGGKILNEALAKVLDAAELKNIEDILALKPQKLDNKNNEVGAPDRAKKAADFADRLFVAINGVGTDADAIVAIFRSLDSLKTYTELQKIYAQKYNEELWEALAGEGFLRIRTAESYGGGYFQTTYNFLEETIKKLK